MISLSWVKDYIDIENENLEELAVKITNAGVNIEKVISNKIDNLVIGEVVDCILHPDSDHLKITKVDVGTEIKQIVCGASNVRKGLKVIVALPGAVLPGNFEIKPGKIRGIDSYGMICALFEIGLEEKNEENYNKGIVELDITAPVGMNAMKYLNSEDTVYELDVHKHRNNDCYYHIGFAYEIGAILGKEVRLPDNSTTPINENTCDFISLKVDTKKCPYYLAKMAKDIVIKESPDFIKKRLLAAGMRPINNVVDISNYVMLEYGQPLHFFDYKKLGNNILVRDAKDKEEIVTLDKKKRSLIANDIVITDQNMPVCIAGVMGGENTEVDSNTNTILIESAIFDSVSIRNTSSRLDLKSEASIRYGKGLNYEYTLLAIERACHLLEKYADAKILSGTVKHDALDKSDKKVSFTVEEINSLLGITITLENVKLELKKLGFDYIEEDGRITATIPKRRLDIEPNINDIAEEIGRLYGYHNLVSTLPICSTKSGKYIGDVKLRKDASKRLRTLGLNECKTYTLTSPDMVKKFKYENKENIVLPNPMSVDKSIVRTTLIPSLLNIYEYNKFRKVNDILLYEIAKTYDVSLTEDTKVSILLKGDYIKNTWNGSMKADFYVMKGIIENLLCYFGLRNRYSFEKKHIDFLHPGISASIILDREEIGVIGKLHPSINKDDVYIAEFSLTKIYEKSTKAIKYKELAKYPSIVKDMSFIVKKDVASGDIENIIKKSGGKLLINVEVFDVYIGENLKNNEKSLAFSLTFNDSTKTLSDEEVMIVFTKIINDVCIKFDAVLRDK